GSDMEQHREAHGERHGILPVPPPDHLAEGDYSGAEQPGDSATGDCATNAARHRPRDIDDTGQLDRIGERDPDNLLDGHDSSLCQRQGSANRRWTANVGRRWRVPTCIGRRMLLIEGVLVLIGSRMSNHWAVFWDRSWMFMVG